MLGNPNVEPHGATPDKTGPGFWKIADPVEDALSSRARKVVDRSLAFNTVKGEQMQATGLSSLLKTAHGPRPYIAGASPVDASALGFSMMNVSCVVRCRRPGPKRKNLTAYGAAEAKPFRLTGAR